MINVSEVMTTLDSLKDCELAVSDLYRTFSIACKPDYREFWRMMTGQEMNHAELIKQIMDLINKDPKVFFPGRVFSSQAMSLLIGSVKESIDGVKKGRIIDDKMFFIARDVENSLIELKYRELLKSELPAYKNIAETIDKETFIHRKMLLNKISIIKPNPQ